MSGRFRAEVHDVADDDLPWHPVVDVDDQAAGVGDLRGQPDDLLGAETVSVPAL